jgi:hypothetical protein
MDQEVKQSTKIVAQPIKENFQKKKLSTYAWIGSPLPPQPVAPSAWIRENERRMNGMGQGGPIRPS